MRYTYRYRSFFWPALLILAGIVALLVNTGQIPVERLALLLDLWPLILIVIGIELILRRTVHGVAGDIAAALIVLIAIAAAAGYVTLAPNPAATRTHDYSAQLGNVSAMTVSINVGGASVEIGENAPSGQLYSAHIEYNGADPRVNVNTDSSTLEIAQNDEGPDVFRARRFALTLEIASQVTWTVHVNSGAATLKVNLPNTHLAGLTLNTGASTDEMTFGTPQAVVPIEINSAAVTVRIHRPRGTIASVDVAGAGLSVNVDGRAYHAVGRISVPQDLGSAGYDIRVNGAACNVTVDTSAASG